MLTTLSATCLPGGFPATPTAPVFGKNVSWGFGTATEFYHIDVWRVGCQDGSGRGPVAPGNATVIGPLRLFQQLHVPAERPAIIRQTPGGSSFCGDLLVATTFVLERQSGPAFDPTGALTLDIDQLQTHTTLEVPAGGGAPQLGITIVSTGCNPCSVGQTATFHIHAVNPGGPLPVELKTGLHFPNGRPTFTLLGVHVEDVLGSGEEDIPLASIVVPGDVPNGTYTLEAAVLEPIFGVTLSRHSRSVVKQ